MDEVMDSLGGSETGVRGKNIIELIKQFQIWWYGAAGVSGTVQISHLHDRLSAPLNC